MAPVFGIARKAGLLAVIVSSLGWLIYLIFFCLTLSDKTYRDRLSPEFFPHWLFLVLGPLLYIITIIHLAFNDRLHLQSIINALLALYLLCGGVIIYTDWIFYYLEYEYNIRYMFEFGSCTVAVVGVIFYTMFKPCFKNPTTVVNRMTHIEASNMESREKQTMETITVTLPMDEKTSSSSPVKETHSSTFAHSYVQSPTNKITSRPVNTIPRVNESTSTTVNKLTVVPSSTVANQTTRLNDKPTETSNAAASNGYTSLIASHREELPLYEETRSPNQHDEDEDIYMNEDENQQYTYEDVSDMNRNKDEYVEVANSNKDVQEEYAELVDMPGEQYEELHP